MPSRSEEDYLKRIFVLAQKGHKRVQTNQIAAALNTSAASVTDMIQKLAQKNYIDYIPYKGVVLRDTGRHKALQLIRSHRLWEYFLCEKLNYDWSEVHDLAEQLEHIQSDDLIDRLEAYLGHPRFDPHGDPIPSADGKYRLSSREPLNESAYPADYILSGVGIHTPEFMMALRDYGIRLGMKIRLEEVVAFDSSVRIASDGESLRLSADIAQNLLVSKSKEE